jgi:hypothetical protein
VHRTVSDIGQGFPEIPDTQVDVKLDRPRVLLRFLSAGGLGLAITKHPLGAIDCDLTGLDFV